jgi:RNA polymerase-binding transcription factor DksA
VTEARTTGASTAPVEARRTALETEHHRLVGLRRDVLGEVSDEAVPASGATGGPGRHPTDGGSGGEDRERSQAVLGQLDQQLRDVDDAIGRLDRGEYGLCEVCGEPIGAARLEALPASRFCVRHRELVERGMGRAGEPIGGAGPVALP